jgi:hypothetical protein
MCLPMPTRRVIAEPRASETPAVAAEQVGRDAALVEKDVPLGVPQREAVPPAASLSGNVGPSLFVGVYRFF